MSTIKFNKDKAIAAVQKKVYDLVKTNAIELQSRIQAKLNHHASNITNGGNTSPAGSPPGNRSGALSRSIQAVDKTTTPYKPHFVVGTKLVYARIQEFGGRIHPAKGKFLPVPIGIDGQRAMKKAKGDLRNLNLQLIRTKSGKLLLVEKGTKQSKILFVLKKSVLLPARPYFRPAIAEQRAAMSHDIALGNLKK